MHILTNAYVQMRPAIHEQQNGSGSKQVKKRKGPMLYPIFIFLGGKTPSILVQFRTNDQRQIWFLALKKASGQNSFHDFYKVGKALPID